MSDLVSPLLQWLNTHPEWAGVATFVISASESIAIIGTIVPGSITMTAIGTLAGAGIIPLWQTIIWAILGAIVGDGISYWIGHYFKDTLRTTWPFKTNPSVLEKGEAFVNKYGVMSVFIGRFVGPVRALVPLVAGMLGMKPLQFTLANVASAIGWAPAYMFPGILLGAASLELPSDIAVHVILVLFLVLLFIVLCLWIIYKLYRLVQNQLDQTQNSIWKKLKSNPYLYPLTNLLKHHDPSKTHGQLNLGFYFLWTVFLFLLLIIYVKWTGPQNIIINQMIFHLFRGVRTEAVENIMIDITLLGQKQVMLPVFFVIFIWLLLIRRFRAGLHALALGILAAAGIFIFKNLIRTPRPWGIFGSPDTYSMPSGHATLSMVVFIGLAFLLSRSVNRKYHWIIYLLSLTIILSVGVSRLYLGAHWFTDLLSAWLLSAAVFLAVVISYQRYSEKSINPYLILMISFITLMFTSSIYHYYCFNELKRIYAPVDWPHQSISMNNWWQNIDTLPNYKTNLFGIPSLRINIEWFSNLEEIKKSLAKEGWLKPPTRDWISTLHRIAGVRSTQYLPMVSAQYLDQKPALIVARRTKDKNLLYLRLWDSHLSIANQSKIWVGIVGEVPRSYDWLFKSRGSNLDVRPDLVFPTNAGVNQWEWKLVTRKPKNSRNQIIQRILFIRPKRTPSSNYAVPENNSRASTQSKNRDSSLEQSLILIKETLC